MVLAKTLNTSVYNLWSEYPSLLKTLTPSEDRCMEVRIKCLFNGVTDHGRVWRAVAGEPGWAGAAATAAAAVVLLNVLGCRLTH